MAGRYKSYQTWIQLSPEPRWTLRGLGDHAMADEWDSAQLCFSSPDAQNTGIQQELFRLVPGVTTLSWEAQNTPQAVLHCSQGGFPSSGDTYRYG